MYRVKKLQFLGMICLSACSFVCTAQANDEKGIRSPIDQLFKGMKLGDSSLVRSSFTAHPTLATISKDKAGQPVLKQESSLKDFLIAVGTPHPKVWYEEIWNVKVQQDGDFAQVWCDYAFYADNTFSHCGVDAFHLYKDHTGWKIFHLADTRRKTGCEVPKEIQEKHE